MHNFHFVLAEAVTNTWALWSLATHALKRPFKGGGGVQQQEPKAETAAPVHSSPGKACRETSGNTEIIKIHFSGEESCSSLTFSFFFFWGNRD
jgi:hypothetical protein